MNSGSHVTKQPAIFKVAAMMLLSVGSLGLLSLPFGASRLIERQNHGRQMSRSLDQQMIVEGKEEQLREINQWYDTSTNRIIIVGVAGLGLGYVVAIVVGCILWRYADVGSPLVDRKRDNGK